MNGQAVRAPPHKNQATEDSLRRRRVILGVSMLMFALLALLQTVGKPRFDTFHGSDVMQLTGAGACFGFGVAALCGLLKLRDE